MGNVEKKKGFDQVCVWPGTLVGEHDIPEFEKWIADEFGVKVQYLEEIMTKPDTKDGQPVPETGGRNDLFFAVCSDDVGKFAVPRLRIGIRWVEDVLAKGNYRSKIYPRRVFGYCTW